MPYRVLLDTHIVIRWLADSKRLSPEQARILNEVIRHRERAAISAITLVEIALLSDARHFRLKRSIDELFADLEASQAIHILPITIEIAREVSSLAILRDPGDRVIAATARVHGLQLLTTDQRIIESNVVSTVE